MYRLSATAALLRPWSLDDRLRIDYLDAEGGTRHQFETRASAAFVTNHRTLGGGLVLPVEASASDGVLELCYVPARPRHSLMLNFARLSAGAPIPEGVLVRVRATEATIETGRDDAFVADGELLATGRRFGCPRPSRRPAAHCLTGSDASRSRAQTLRKRTGSPWS